jgi:hypothetical protein
VWAVSELGELWEGAEVIAIDSKNLPKRPRVIVHIPDISEVSSLVTPPSPESGISDVRLGNHEQEDR